VITLDAISYHRELGEETNEERDTGEESKKSWGNTALRVEEKARSKVTAEERYNSQRSERSD